MDVDLVVLDESRQTLFCVLDFELLMDGVLGGNGFSFDLLSLRSPTFSSVGSVQDRSAVNIFDGYTKEWSAGESLEDQSKGSGTIGISRPELLLAFTGPGCRETKREIDSTVVVSCILGRRLVRQKAHAQYFDRLHFFNRGSFISYLIARV